MNRNENKYNKQRIKSTITIVTPPEAYGTEA